MLRRGAKAQAEVPDSFIDTLLRELVLVRAAMGHLQVDALYFGGGTPSLLTPRQVSLVMAAIEQAFSVSDNIEITFEGEASSLQRGDLLQCLRAHGVRRVSFGLQTFDSALRDLLGRSDTTQDLIRTIEALHRLDFTDINVDYLYCLPGTTADFVRAELDLLADFGVTSVDCHPLKYSSCAPAMLARIAEERRRVPDAATRIDMFEAIYDGLRACGFTEQFADQYSRVCDAAPNSYMRRLYGLDGGEYIGLGPGARSHFADHGLQNVQNLARYSALVSDGHRPIHKVVFAPHADNYVSCFPKRNDCLSADRLALAPSSAYFRQQLDHLARGGFVTADDGHFTLTRLGLRWYQNLQEDLLSESQKARHAATAQKRETKLEKHGEHFGALRRC